MIHHVYQLMQTISNSIKSHQRRSLPLLLFESVSTLTSSQISPHIETKRFLDVERFELIYFFLCFSATGFRPVIDANSTTRNTPPLFFPPHLASHISSQFSPPLFPTLKGKSVNFAKKTSFLILFWRFF